LWIDTLCIIQDDEEDMTRELGKMNLIYSNSACMIAASDSQNVMEDCFLPRPQPPGREPLEKVHIKLKTAEGKSTASIRDNMAISQWLQRGSPNRTNVSKGMVLSRTGSIPKDHPFHWATHYVGVQRSHRF
jgi:hypothetical protein